MMSGTLLPMLLPHYRVTQSGRIATLGGRELPLDQAEVKLAVMCNGLVSADRLAALSPNPTGIARSLVVLEEQGVIACLPPDSDVDALPSNQIIISPHIDDAALSLGGMIARFRAEGQSVHVINIFSEQTYQTGLRVPTADLGRIARAEDYLAGRKLGYRSAFMGLRGVRDRHDLSLRQTIGQPRDVIAPNGRFGSDVALVKAAIMDGLSKAATESSQIHLFAPLGCGGHVDHLLVHGAVAELARGEKLPKVSLNWYEDLPYAAALPIPATGQASGASCEIGPGLWRKASGSLVRTIDIAPYREIKRMALKIFRTRVRDMDIQKTMNHGKMAGGRGREVERVFSGNLGD